MNQAIILHGTDNNSQGNWIPWLKEQLTAADWQVWTPDLPNSAEPNMSVYLDYLQANAPFSIDKHTTLIGHSSGAVAVLGLLQSLPTTTQIKQALLVSAFHDSLGWDKLNQLFNLSLDFSLIKNKARQFIFLHSDSDPYVELSQAEFLAEQVGGQLQVIPGQGHFNLEASPEYRQFPQLLTLALAA